MLHDTRRACKVGRTGGVGESTTDNGDEMRTVLIANPVSGKHRGAVAAVQACEQLRAAGWDAEIRLTQCPRDAVRLAAEAAEEGFDVVFACGGDGTLSEVMTGLLDTGVPAGVIPAGTGNDFARCIGLPLHPTAAATLLAHGRSVPVDMLELNEGALWAINVIGTGFDCRVCERINRRSNLVGGLPAYLLALAQEMVNFRPTGLSLRVDDTRWEGDALLVAICNTRSYGAGMNIAPDADIYDGLMDVVVVSFVGRVEFLRAFPRVFKGTHLDHPAVHVWRGAEVEVGTTQPSLVNVDGDLCAHTPLRVKACPGRGRLWVAR
jgi:diacylglycerol kinase (ATP)